MLEYVLLGRVLRFGLSRDIFSSLRAKKELKFQVKNKTQNKHESSLSLENKEMPIVRNKLGNTFPVLVTQGSGFCSGHRDSEDTLFFSTKLMSKVNFIDGKHSDK